MNYYTILKEHLRLIHNLHPQEFQVTLEELSVLNFSLVEIKTYLPIRFVFFTETEMLLTQKEEKNEKVQVNNDIYYFEVISKPIFDIIVFT